MNIMNKNILLGLATLSVVGAVLVPQTVLAYRGDSTVKGPNHTEAREQAIEQENLSAFKATCTVGRICDVVDTQDELHTLKLMHDATEKGDLTKASEFRTKLGLGLRNGTGQRNGTGYGRNSR